MRVRYQQPSLDDLRASAKIFVEQYKSPGQTSSFFSLFSAPNYHRYSFIALYDQLATKITANVAAQKDLDPIINVLIGAQVFELTDVKFREYVGKSPKEAARWYLFNAKTGSELYTLIKQRLNLSVEVSDRTGKKSKNRMGYDERLFYLHEFYQYIRDTFTEADFEALKRHPKVFDTSKAVSHLIWASKQDLEEKIHGGFKPIFERINLNVNRLIHGVPLLNALLQNLLNIEEEYAQKSCNPTNPKRLAIIKFLKFVLLTFEKTNPKDISWHTLAGITLVALLSIKDEYKWLNPKRSAMYSQMLAALNQKDFDNITLDDKIKWLTALSAHLIQVTDDEDNFYTIAKRIYEGSEKCEENSKELCKEIRYFQIQINQFLEKLNLAKIHPSNAEWYISTGTSYFIQYVVGPGAFQLASAVLIGGLSIGGFAVAGPLGLLVSGAGTAMISCLGMLGGYVTEGVISAVTANLFVWVLRKVGDTVGSVTATVATYPFTPNKESLDAMRLKLSPEDDMAFVNMVNTILRLDLITDDEKVRVRNVVGVKEGEFLKPRMPLVFRTPADEARRRELQLHGCASTQFHSDRAVLIIQPTSDGPSQSTPSSSSAPPPPTRRHNK